jgi:hypothetical protein
MMQLHSSLEYRHGETVIVLYAGHVWRPLSHCLRVKSDDRAHYNNMYMADDYISSPRFFVYPENIYHTSQNMVSHAKIKNISTTVENEKLLNVSFGGIPEVFFFWGVVSRHWVICSRLFGTK